MPCSDIKPIANELLLGVSELFAQLQNYDKLLSEYEDSKAEPQELQGQEQQWLPVGGAKGAPEARGGVVARFRHHKQGPFFLLIACLLLGAAYVLVRGVPGEASSSQGKLL
jgi:hypothetical protein